MPKIKYYFILTILFCMGLSVSAGAQCWRWNANPIPSPIGSPYDENYATFDEARRQPALFQDNDIMAPKQLWHYDGRVWSKTWEGELNPPHGGEYYRTTGIYFDRIRKSLVLIGSVEFDFEQGAAVAFEYHDGEGWMLITELSGATGGWGLAYDAERKRAVTYGSQFGPCGGHLEFDGNYFYAFQNWISCQFEGGQAGYDETSKRVVFRGYYDFSSSDIKTFEYDGISWNEVATDHNLPGDVYCTGLTYMPEFGGLLAKPFDAGLAETWVYRNNDWERIQLGQANETPPIYAANMIYNPDKHVVVLVGGDLESTAPSTTVWEFRRRSHCRPVTRP